MGGDGAAAGYNGMLLPLDISCSKSYSIVGPGSACSRSFIMLCMLLCTALPLLFCLRAMCANSACCSSYLCKARLCGAMLIELVTLGFIGPVQASYNCLICQVCQQMADIIGK